MVSVNTSPRKRGLRNMLLHTRTFVITLGDFRYGIQCSGMRSRDDAANPGKNHMPKTGTRGEELHRRLRRFNFSWDWKDVLQRPSKKCANIGEQDPGIAWEKSQARAGRNFSQPRTIYLISRSVYSISSGGVIIPIFHDAPASEDPRNFKKFAQAWGTEVRALRAVLPR